MRKIQADPNAISPQGIYATTHICWRVYNYEIFDLPNRRYRNGHQVMLAPGRWALQYRNGRLLINGTNIGMSLKWWQEWSNPKYGDELVINLEIPEGVVKEQEPVAA